MLGQSRVIVAMSGGVDSSVAAALLLREGYQVEGLTMRLWREDGAHDKASANARAVCAHLGIEWRELDLRKDFYDEVVAHFIAEYACGRTPNPCLVCNRQFKFGRLLAYAQDRQGAFLATGHYARVERQGDEMALLTAVDPSKDQSYVLYALQQAPLRRILFPLGRYTKAQVRALATEWGLPVAQQGESQDACFIRDNDYRRFIAERLPQAVRPGPIYDLQGRRLGEHKGLPFYTIGQREGLGIAAPQPLYVMRIDTHANTLIVGVAQQLGRQALLAADMTYISGHPPALDAVLQAQIRYRARRTPAQVLALPGNRARVTFAQRLRDITPGQAVVLYDGERVLGGGLIESAIGCE